MRRWLPLLAWLLAVSWPATAAETECPATFLDGQPPVLVNQRLAPRTQPLCFRAYAVLHSGVAHEPIWSAEHLTARGLRQARALVRVDAFHEEDRLPPGDGAQLEDYARSGYDRGHMSPSADMPDRDAQAESFSLANMVPQDSELNRGLWASIEGAVRGLAGRDGGLYVVTGPVFGGDELRSLGGGLLVPSAVFKAIYDPRRRTAGAYVARNADDAGWQPVSIAQLRQLTGLDVFPSLPAGVAEAGMTLPTPTPQHPGQRRPRRRRTLLEELLWPR